MITRPPPDAAPHDLGVGEMALHHRNLLDHLAEEILFPHAINHREDYHDVTAPDGINAYQLFHGRSHQRFGDTYVTSSGYKLD